MYRTQMWYTEKLWADMCGYGRRPRPSITITMSRTFRINNRGRYNVPKRPQSESNPFSVELCPLRRLANQSIPAKNHIIPTIPRTLIRTCWVSSFVRIQTKTLRSYAAIIVTQCDSDCGYMTAATETSETLSGRTLFRILMCDSMNSPCWHLVAISEWRTKRRDGEIVACGINDARATCFWDFACTRHSASVGGA